MSVICVIWYKIFTVFQNYWGGGACLVISRVELIIKDKKKFRSARKIPPSGKRPLDDLLYTIHSSIMYNLFIYQIYIYSP
jgi:hypothetical protein